MSSINRKITNLPAVVGASILDTDIMPIVAGLVTSKTTIADLKVKFTPAGQVNLKDYAVGNGIIDDTAAINTWYSLIPDGGTGLIPLGAYRHTSQLVFNRNVNLVGLGPGSAFVPDLNNAGIDAIVFNNTASSLLYRIRLDNFAILSSHANAGRDALVLNRVFLSEVNVHVKASTARYGTRLVGCISNNIKITSSVNVTNITQVVAGGYPYTSGVPALTQIRVQRDAVNGYSFNNNVLDVRIEGGNEGVWIEDQISQGNNFITGVIEGVLGKGFYAKACIGLNISNLHCESNTSDFELDACSACIISGGSQMLPTIGGGYLVASGRITLTDCTRIELGAVYCDNLVVGTGCSRIQLTAAFRYGAGGTGTSIITDTANKLQGYAGQITGITASTASGTPVTLLDLSTRGAGRYSVIAYVANTAATHAVADFFYDGANASRMQGTNAAAMTTTLAGNNIQATQTTGGPLAISYIITFTPVN